MTDTPEARQALASAMDKRRQELDLLWQDVSDASGLSLKTLYSAREDPDAPLTPRTARKIEAGLQWQAGSVRRVLEGGAPVPLGAGADHPSEGADAAAAMFPRDLTAQRIWRLHEPVEVREALIAELRAIRRRGSGQPGDSLTEGTA